MVRDGQLPVPREAGFAMPAEWEKHSACYISWPCKESTWHGHIADTRLAYTRVIKTISRFEPVHVLATSQTSKEAREMLGEGAEIIEMPLDDSWFRDNGPMFVRESSGGVAMVKFEFNAWGNKFPPYTNDDNAPIRLAKLLGMRLFMAPLVLEGGSINVDGGGTLLTTEECLLNRNRNPTLSKEGIEQCLRDFLGVKKIIWLGRGVEGDITDGHVDGVACFSGPHLVTVSHTNDQSDPNFAVLEENVSRLESEADAKGRPFEIVKVVQARPRRVEGIAITPGYTNHYIANGGVIVPTYGIPEDEKALETLRAVYPDREVLGVRSEYIEIGGGAVHCITQQRPAGHIVKDSQV